MNHQQYNFPLSEAPLGHMVRIRHLRTEPGIGLRLRELGMSENALIRCIHRGFGNVICQVTNTRIAVNLGLARRILVSSIELEELSGSLDEDSATPIPLLPEAKASPVE